MITLQNAHQFLTLDPQSADWRFQFAAQPNLIFDAAAPVVLIRRGYLRHPVALASLPLEVSDPQRVNSMHGVCQEMRLSWQADENGAGVSLVFRLLESAPVVMMQLKLHNDGGKPFLVDQMQFFHAGLEFGSPADSLAFHSNGWQSWAMTGTYGARESAWRTKLRFIQSPLVENPGTPYFNHPGHYSSDLYGILGSRSSRVGLLAGFLSQREHFGSLEAWTVGKPGLRLWANGDDTRLDPGQTMMTDWAVLTPIDLDATDPMGWYLAAVARENDARSNSSAPVGWCSWYHFYTHVTAEDVRANLKTLATVRDSLPLDLVQIDDGFESQVGDWFTFQPTFPDGVEPLRKEIHAAGFTPGLWLAPFILHPQAKLVKEHPEYLLRNRLGRPVNAGFIWNVFTRALDITNPGALDYACRVVQTAAKDWGFPYLKLDFIYAGALAGVRYDPTLTRAKALRRALEALRGAVGEETYLLGCGAPLGPSVGIFDAMRIGADVAGDWSPVYNNNRQIFKYEPHMPSLRNGLQNTLTRAPLHARWWVNDPDCLMVRPDTRLTLEEVQSAAAVTALTGGSLLLSDDLPQLPPDRLRLAATLLPVIGERAQVLDWFDHLMPGHLRLDLQGAIGDWSLLALFNWEDQPRPAVLTRSDFHLDSSPLTYHSFWGGENGRWEGEELRLGTLPAHGVRLLSVRLESADKPAYLGSDLHISQGQEVRNWEWDGMVLKVTFALPRRAEGFVLLTLPGKPTAATLNGVSVTAEALGAGVYRFPVVFDRKAELWVEVAAN